MVKSKLLSKVEQALATSWGEDTSAGGYSVEVPATGQCAVTALVLQDYLGGALMRTMVGAVSHYWLRTDEGRDIDLTASQFDEPVAYAAGVVRERAYVLSFPATVERYTLLSARVRESLGEN